MLERCELLNELEGRGIRMTAQRRALIDTIQRAEGHLDAASLLAQARKLDPRINRATVYRNIELLKSLGLIDELDLMHMNGEKHYYEVRTRKEHLHLTCLGCGNVEEFLTPTFERLKHEIAKDNSFDIQVMRLEIGGLCSACTAEKKKHLQ